MEIFRRSDTILDEETLDRGLDLIGGDHSYSESFYHSILDFARFFERTQNQYLDGDLLICSRELSQSLRTFGLFLATHFFVYPENRNFEDPRYCLYPDLNIDRAGKGHPGDMVTYAKFAKQLNEIVTEAWDTFQTYRNAVKVTLMV